ncbi:hypothetical protein OEZ85_003366 [Tetradesmus obliquus]|uniref:Sushi domain-containing protein n=1 Tax=Tetradesmus obliquus TaxID=3088 RepID=A0ABY8UE78_TETOB|nr:hypothetical protein OEZ85_003366 [Tetradesmus obliquus]
MKPLQFVLLTIATAVHCCPRARASEGAPAAATAAATAPPCPTGYRAESKGEASADSNGIGWTRDQAGLAGLVVASRTSACKCAPGWGSHVLAGTGPLQLPTAAPSCPFFIVNGANAANCRCFRCPAGHTSFGGLLNSAGAACRKTSSTPRPPPAPARTADGTAQTAYIRVNFTAPAASAPCSHALKARLAKTLRAGLTSRHKNTRNAAVTVQRCTAYPTARRGAAPAQKADKYLIDFKVDFEGRRYDIFAITGTSANPDTQQGICTYGICTDIEGAAGAVTEACAADAAFDDPLPPPSPSPTVRSPSPSPSPSPPPPGTCLSAPTASTPNSPGWPATCAGTAVGNSCKAPCDTAAGATGTSYTASCIAGGKWNVTGNCTAAPKTCSKAPDATTDITNQTSGWAASCVGAAIGTTCQAPCTSSFTGSGYQVNCTAAGTWGAPTGNCALKTCSGAPSATAPSNSTGWPARCTNLTIGATCTANCTAEATGPGLIATCSDAEIWTVTGNCTAKVCTGTPPAASNATAWNTTACAGKLMGGDCSAACLPTATGAGYVATCTRDGTWNVTGSCAVKTCTNLPATVLAPNSAGWPSTTNSTANITSCIGTAINGTCRAPCASNATGIGYIATCNDTNTWQVTGSCAIRNCTMQPPFNLTLMVEWSANCSNTINGGNCNASCLTTATGPGYTSICREGTWLNATGSCVAKTCFQNPPDQSNQAAGWSCPSNSTSSTLLDQSCSTSCASNFSGPGYQAFCTNDADFWPGMNGTVNATTGQVINGIVVPRPSVVFGSWRVTGSCQLRVCPGLPGVPPYAASDWNASCANLTAGSNCTLACAANSTGGSYTALCLNGNWTVTGECSLNQCPAQPLTAAGYGTPLPYSAQQSWNCSATTPGSSCSLPCTNNATGMYYATCTNNSNWTISGGCSLKTCLGLPPLGAFAEGWPASCANATHGSLCNATCWGNSTGAWQALCNSGNWTITTPPGSGRRLKTCPGLPPAEDLALNWSATCTNAVHGTVCESNCTANATGLARALCSNGSWVISQESTCTLTTCPGLPPLGAFAEGWPASCANATHGSLCNATCWGNSTGAWQALCNSGNWTITTPPGSGCRLKTCPVSPPAHYLTLGWNTSCTNAVHGTVCESNCTANATGLARALCSNGSWVISQESTCALRVCPGLPAVPPNAASNWNASCANLTVGSQCRLACAANTTGIGYMAFCRSSTNWTVTGECSCCIADPPAALVLYAAWDCGDNTANGRECTAAGCTPGYAVVGPITATCQDGVWGSPTGSCSAVSAVGSPYTAPGLSMDLASGQLLMIGLPEWYDVIADNWFAGSVSVSADAGYTWTIPASSPANRWEAVTMSCCGTRQFALSGLVSGYAQGGLWVSLDAGVTWSRIVIPSVAAMADVHQSVSANDAGTRVAVGTTQQVLLGEDSGAGQFRWRQILVTDASMSAAMNGVGDVVVAWVDDRSDRPDLVDLRKVLYISVDGGSNWVQRTPAAAASSSESLWVQPQWRQVAVSADGFRMAALRGSGEPYLAQGSIYISSNAGRDWVRYDLGSPLGGCLTM